MKIVTLAGGLVMLALSHQAASAATVYPYCSREEKQYENCGYQTLQQCWDDIRGIGGICGPNPRYVYVEPYERPRKKRRQQR